MMLLWRASFEKLFEMFMNRSKYQSETPLTLTPAFYDLMLAEESQSAHHIENDRLDTFSSFQYLYFARFFDIVGYEH